MVHDLVNALSGQNLAVLFRRTKAGSNGIDANIVRRPFPRQEMSDLVDSAFGYGIREYLGKRWPGGDRGNIDDAAAAAGIYHHSSENLAGEENALQIDIENAMPFFFADLEKRRAGVDAGGIDQNIHATEFREHPVPGIL